MGVNSVKGQDLAALFVRSAALAPAPHPRTAETARGNAPAARPAPGPGEEQVQRAASTDRSAPTVADDRTRLRIDETSKRIVAQILDENNEVIRQIPPEELLRIAARFRELQGLLFDERT